MTCIVGLIETNKETGGTEIFVGGDSAAVGSSHWIDARKGPKVFVKDNFIYGFTSSFRMGDILQYSFVEPLRDPKASIDSYLRNEYVDALRQHFKDKGFITVDKQSEHGGTFILGYSGRLFTVESDFQIGESIRSYVAVGSGNSHAQGSLYSTEGMNIPARDRIVLALEAAENHVTSVRSPFVVESLVFL